jgi:hypothetical protein
MFCRSRPGRANAGAIVERATEQKVLVLRRVLQFAGSWPVRIQQSDQGARRSLDTGAEPLWMVGTAGLTEHAHSGFFLRGPPALMRPF